MTTITRIEALEDNGGGLHLAIFVNDTCTHFFSGFEYGDKRAPTMQDEISGAVEGGVSGWDGDAENPATEYAALTSHQYGWELIAEWNEGALAVYEDAMGVAGKRWARVQADD